MKFSKRIINPLLVIMLSPLFFIVGCTSGDEQILPSTTTEVPSTTTEVPGITTTDSDGVTSVDETVLTEVLETLPEDDLDAEESAGLVYMREEEKLARDVYIFLFGTSGAKVFDNISESEQTHTDAILTLLDRYNIIDPVGDNTVGVFEDAFLQGLYDALTVQGSSSLVNALYVGAEIEEIDLIDIQNLVDALDGNEDVAVVYESLMKGSRNHLRAFVDNLAKQGVDYQPLHLSQEVYDAIINSDIESN